MKSRWVFEAWDELFEDLLSCCLSRFVFGRIRLGKPAKVVYDDEDVLVCPSAGLQMKVVDADQIQRRAGCDGAHRSTYMSCHFLIDDAWTFSGNIVLYVLLHIRPVEPLTHQRKYSLCANMSHVVMKMF